MPWDTLTTLLGWCLILNAGLLAVSTLALTAARPWIVQLHSRISGLNEAELLRAYFQYLGHYKILVLVFNLAPYVALKLMGY
ncbi:MAG: hypothetical protein EP312_08000 [Gammaproteobacteria bacterium]|nr:MAG: hypothetical protein EP312_08000 [Gammaproteobacteria bacterium]